MSEEQKVDPKRILVIDDEPSFTRMVCRTLEADLRYIVREVNRSTDALASAVEFKPDLVLLDIVMPEADGGDIASSLREHPVTANIPILFVSAMVSPKETKDGFYTSGGERFLAKPVSAELLLRAVEDSLS